MNKLLLTFAMTALSSASVMAQTVQKVTINGAEVGKNIASISIEGENANIIYADKSTQLVDLANLSVSFDYSKVSPTTGVSTLSYSASKADGAAYDLQGKPKGKDYRGVVIKNGKKFNKKK